MSLEKAINAAMLMNAGRITLIGELCRLEANIQSGKDISSSVNYLNGCRKMPNIQAVLQLIN